MRMKFAVEVYWISVIFHIHRPDCPVCEAELEVVAIDTRPEGKGNKQGRVSLTQFLCVLVKLYFGNAGNTDASMEPPLETYEAVSVNELLSISVIWKQLTAYGVATR